MIKLLFLTIITTIEASYYTPLSECHKARISQYTGWEVGGACNFDYGGGLSVGVCVSIGAAWGKKK